MTVLATSLFSVFVAYVGIQFVRLARRWSRGRTVQADFLRGVANLPYAYFHHVHEVVARQPKAARMHAGLVGGLAASLLLALLLSLYPGSIVLLLCRVLAQACAFVGVCLLIGRRWIRRSDRLSAGLYQVLPLLFMLTLGFFAALSWLLRFPDALSPASTTVLLLLAFLGPGLLLSLAVDGPLRHAFAGLAHLAVHTRPERLRRATAAAPSTALRVSDLSDEIRSGSARIEDFGWNRLASFDSCVQCGRCEAVCPANAAGLPLNPKKLINDFALGMSAPGTVQRYAGNGHPGHGGTLIGGGPLVDFVKTAENPTGWIADETIWACTTCRACVYECPMLIEHVDAIVDVRRHQVMELGSAPGRAPDALANLSESDTLTGRPLAERFLWATDLGLPLFSDVGEADYLLWVGEGGYDQRHQKTLRALVALLRKAGLDFAVLGAEELDCGDTARRLGDERGFDRLAAANIEILSRYRFSRIVTADPHVLHCLSTEYPQKGGRFNVVHHTTLLWELAGEGRLRPPADGPFEVTYHDPCYLGRYSGELTSPRRLLEEMGGRLREMDLSGMRSSCCGGGGAAPLTEIAGKSRIPDMRMDHARSTGAGTLAVACPGCMSMLDGVPGDKPVVVDIAELLLERVA